MTQDIENEAVNNEEEQQGQNPEAQDADNSADSGAAGADNSAKEPEEDWKDKYVRLSAEFDNYRKRTLREKMELVQTGGADVVRSMLPVMDDLERALSAMEKAEDVESVRKGVFLIQQKFQEALRGRGVTEIEALGKEFDADFHEAVAKIPAPDEESKGKVIDVIQKGYMMGEKVLRYPKVVYGE